MKDKITDSWTFKLNTVFQIGFSSLVEEAARFKDRQEGLLRHLKVQSKTPYTVYAPTRDTLRWWNSSFRKTSCRRSL